MSTFHTSLTPTPNKNKGIPYNWFTDLLDNTLSLKQGDIIHDYLLAGQVQATDTGTVNNHNPAAMDVQWTGSSAVTFTGIVAHGIGDIRIYHNVHASLSMAFGHESLTSSAANRLKLPASGQYIGPNGSIGFKYDGNLSRWVVLFINPGKPIDVAYSAGLFSATGGGTWTFPSGATNLVTFAYSQMGASMDVQFFAQNTTISGTVNFLNVVMPGAFATARQVGPQLVDARSNGVYVPALPFYPAAASSISIYRQDRNLWPAGAANNDVTFSIRVNVA